MIFRKEHNLIYWLDLSWSRLTLAGSIFMVYMAYVTWGYDLNPRSNISNKTQLKKYFLGDFRWANLWKKLWVSIKLLCEEFFKNICRSESTLNWRSRRLWITLRHKTYVSGVRSSGVILKGWPITKVAFYHISTLMKLSIVNNPTTVKV